jgi:hypothetical protein
MTPSSLAVNLVMKQATLPLAAHTEATAALKLGAAKYGGDMSTAQEPRKRWKIVQKAATQEIITIMTSAFSADLPFVTSVNFALPESTMEILAAARARSATLESIVPLP